MMHGILQLAARAHIDLATETKQSRSALTAASTEASLLPRLRDRSHVWARPPRGSLNRVSVSTMELGMNTVVWWVGAPIICLSLCGCANAERGPTFTPGETGNRYDICYPVDVTGRPIVSSIPDSACKLLEFAREDCEAIVRSSHAATLNRPPCLDFREEDVRPKPTSYPAALVRSTSRPATQKSK